MTIPLIKEPPGIPYLEKCHFCGKRTRYWHKNTNTPVCGDCAKIHRVAELPNGAAQIKLLGQLMNRALIIKKKWLDLIFDNGKIFEMRSTKTNVRGEIGLIEAGSGLIVGRATLKTCGKALNEFTALMTAQYHQIADLDLIKKWKYPWVLENTKRFDNPIPYSHPQGAVVWVKLPCGIDKTMEGKTMKITDALLLSYGFKQKDYGNCPPFESWEKDDIEVWNFNRRYWLVDALDQAGIEVKFKTIGQLSAFFKACGRSLSGTN